MNAGHHPDGRENRRLSLLLVLLLHAGALSLLLLQPAGWRPPAPPAPALTMVDIPAPAPSGAQQEEEAAPAPVLADIPVSLPPPPIEIETPLPAAPLPQSESGGPATAGPVAGGNGSGGMASSGSGSGGNGIAVRARRIAGAIHRQDFPRVPARGMPASSVTIRLAISADGRPTECTILRPSSDPARDRRTCELALQRFRYAPARDAAGKAVEDVAGWRQDWWPD